MGCAHQEQGGWMKLDELHIHHFATCPPSESETVPRCNFRVRRTLIDTPKPTCRENCGFGKDAMQAVIDEGDYPVARFVLCHEVNREGVLNNLYPLLLFEMCD